MIYQISTPDCPISVSYAPSDPRFVIDSGALTITINSNDRSLDGQVVELQITATSLDTFYNEDLTLIVTFRSDCRDATVQQAPNFAQASY